MAKFGAKKPAAPVTAEPGAVADAAPPKPSLKDKAKGALKAGVSAAASRAARGVADAAGQVAGDQVADQMGGGVVGGLAGNLADRGVSHAANQQTQKVADRVAAKVNGPQDASFASAMGAAAPPADGAKPLALDVKAGRVLKAGEPCSFEAFCEVERARKAWTAQDADLSQKIVETFGVSLIDWTMIFSAYWTQKIASDPELARRLAAAAA